MRPMSSLTISASASSEVRISGRMAQTTARQERKATKHSRVTARYTPSSIWPLACLTTMLVALSMPALPAASRKRASASLYSAAKRWVTSTTASRVSALWSLR
ncbi:hypothetical protein D3C75_914850 [compost metagenome]